MLKRYVFQETAYPFFADGIFISIKQINKIHFTGMRDIKLSQTFGKLFPACVFLSGRRIQ